MIQYHIDQVDNPQLIESINQIKNNIIKFFLFLTCNCDESNKGILGTSLCLTSKGISKNIQNNNYSKKINHLTSTTKNNPFDMFFIK